MFCKQIHHWMFTPAGNKYHLTGLPWPHFHRSCMRYLCVYILLTCYSDPSYKACLFYRQNVGVVCWLMNVFWRFQQVCYSLFIWFEILVLSTTFNTIFSNIVAVNLSNWGTVRKPRTFCTCMSTINF